MTDAPLSRRSMLLGVSRTALAGAFGVTGLIGLSSCSGRRQSASTIPAEGGIGGTGIVGTVLASTPNTLSVNGFALSITDETQLFDAFGERPFNSLKPGHSVTVVATRRGDSLFAHRIGLTQPVIGRVGAVDTRDNSFTLLGARVVQAAQAGSLPELGQRVAVSGLWRGSDVVASLVEPLNDDGLSVAAGSVAQTGDSKTRVGSVLATLPIGASAPEPGSFVTVTGTEGPGGIEPRDIELGRFVGDIPAFDSLSVEGYLEPVDAAPGYTVSGLGHSFDNDAKLRGLPEQRMLFVGPYRGTFMVSHGKPLPETAAGRRTVLAALGDPLQPTAAFPTR
ncbi:MAG: DUF5666 domain-containing protein [Pseudomonadota bacterium]